MRLPARISLALMIVAGVLFPTLTLKGQDKQAINPLTFIDNFTDEDIDKRIEGLKTYLLSKQKADGNWAQCPGFDGADAGWPTGPTAAVVYALIESGVSAKDPRIVKALEWLEKNSASDFKTYSIGLRCNAWYAANKQTSNQYRKSLERDVDLLVNTASHMAGGVHYDCYDMKDDKAWDDKIKGIGGFKIGTFPGDDNSNSQYVLLGVWAGLRNGVEVPKEFWEKSLKFWIFRQREDGGWNYMNGADEKSYGSMSTAGLASLFVCIDATMSEKFIKCNVATEYAPVKKALDWFDANFEKTLIAPWIVNDVWYFKYYMYGVERIGLASGYKYFGKSDWFIEGCKRMLAEKEFPEAEDPRGLAYYAYELLFLSRGRRPVLYNKLEYDGDWNNRPRALANFCRWAETAYEHEVNWQIVTLKSDVREWHDAPVLLITGSKGPKFSDDDIAKLRTYVNQGGTILSVTECGGGAFGMGMRTLYRKLFPKYELTNCGRDHPLFSSHYKLAGMPPQTMMVSNGIRPLAIQVDTDLPLSWQTYAVATAKANFEAGANILSYVTEKELYGRGTNIWPDLPSSTPSKTVKIARIRYAGNYDPEPLAFERLARILGKKNGIKLDYGSASAATQSASSPAVTTGIAQTGLAIAELTGDIKLAFMTGTGAFKLTTEEKTALKKWVESGGLLLIDAAGGNKAFAGSAKDMVVELWGSDSLLPLPMSSPIYKLKDCAIDKVKYRKTTKTRNGGISEPSLLAVLAGDVPKVILSNEDLTAGLVGYSSWALDGYMPASAFEIVRNIVLYVADKTASGQSGTPAATTKP